MAINAQLSADIVSTIGTTTDGSSTVNIYSQPAFLANDGGQVVTFDIIGIDFTNDEVASAKILVRLKNVGGTPSIIGSPVHIVPFSAGSSSALVNCSASVTIVGTNIRVNVIGIADRTIKWTCNRFPSLSVLDNWTAVPSPADGYIQAWDNATSRWEPTDPEEVFSIAGYVTGGDLSGTLPNPTVDGIQGKALDADLATVGSSQDGYVLSWDDGDSEWQAKPLSSLGTLIGPVISDVSEPINISYVIDTSPDGTRDFFLVAATSGITLTLPAIQQGRTFIIKNTSAGNITIGRNNAGDRIENVASDYTMAPGCITLICSTYNNNWHIVSAS